MLDAKVCYWYTGCVGLLVLDSSALITLAGAGALRLLTLSPHKACTVTEVYRETVEAGWGKARAEAVEIARCFDRKMVTIQDPLGSEKLAGISRTDSQVLLLAEETGAADLLTNDRTLLAKAEQRGLPACVTAEFVMELHENGKISRKRRDRLLGDFLDRGRYSEEFLRALLLGR